MPFFAGGFVATTIKTFKSTVYETAIALINYANNIASTAFSALIYLKTDLPGYIAKITYANSTTTATPYIVTAGIEYSEIIKAIAVGAPVVVGISALCGLAIDFIKDTNHFDASVGKILNHPTPPNGYYFLSEQTSERIAFAKRSWPWFATTLSGIIGCWWLGYSSMQFNQVMACTSIGTLSTLVGTVVIGFGVNELYSYRKRNHMLINHDSNTATQFTSFPEWATRTTSVSVAPVHIVSGIQSGHGQQPQGYSYYLPMTTPQPNYSNH